MTAPVEKTSTCCPATPRACLRRVTMGVMVALVLGVGSAAVGGYLFGDFASVGDDLAQKTYLVTLPDDEDMLRNLSQQLMSAEGSEASALSEIAPAAGEPLGTLAE